MQHLINTKEKMKEAIKALVNSPRLSCDNETYGPDGIGGLYPFHGSRSFAVIFANHTDEYYFDFNVGGINPKYKKDLQPIFDDETKIVYYVNAIFDTTINHFDGLEIKSRIVDCSSMARLDFNQHGKAKTDKETFLSMEYLANYYEVKQKNDIVKKYIVEHQLYHTLKDKFTGKKIPRYDLVPIDLMFEYGCDDVRTTFDLGQKIISCINYKDETYGNDEKIISVAQNEIKLTSVLLDMKIKGFRHWENYTQKAITHEKEISLRLHAEINALTNGLNLNSGKQIAQYLICHGVNVPKNSPTDTALTRSSEWLRRAEIAKKAGKIDAYNKAYEKAQTYALGNYKTDKKTLEKLLKQHPELDFLSKITEAKEADKKLSTYYENFMLLQDENKIIHCALHQDTTKTGRFSATSPNLQNLEKVYSELNNDDDFCIRKSLIADEGCRLFFFDYDQQEMIVMLDQSEEMAVIYKLLSKEFKDFYLATAAILKEVLNIEITRQQAKAMALGLAYGKGLELLARELGYIMPNADEDEIEKGKNQAKEFKDKFFSALPELKKFTKNLEYQIKRKGRIVNPFGRVTYIDQDNSYKALNAYVQGTSADITKTSMVNIHKAFKTANIGKSRLTLCVHDEIIVNVEIGKEDIVIPLIKTAMTQAYKHKHIQLSVGIDYAPLNKHGISAWGEKTEWSL